ncbi:putative membrane protein YwzB [Lentibacillus sp. JNUCC-1]|uniref:DUF1146 family protein n=1 Tax=Lentibacillus sp. JNUCC-1 TaxID=2654513 RepID=UPI001325E274|nr:DUF1146 family protein [Lentibacillus sp. JNUCC-1]MUV37379.1 putative membrane protein YwzB [Lentibacillus sp. JNUCC-1]
MDSIGITAVTGIVSHIIFILITWRVLQAINFDPLFRKGRAAEARLLLLLIAIVVGTGVSRFFLDILQWSQDLRYLL